MPSYEDMARAAELEGHARAARLRAQGFEQSARAMRGDDAEDARRRWDYDQQISREVAAGRMCPGGCDTAVGGCITHSDSC